MNVEVTKEGSLYVVKKEGAQEIRCANVVDALQFEEPAFPQIEYITHIADRIEAMFALDAEKVSIERKGEVWIVEVTIPEGTITIECTHLLSVGGVIPELALMKVARMCPKLA